MSGCCLRTESVVYFWGVSEWLLFKNRQCGIFWGVSEWLLFKNRQCGIFLRSELLFVVCWLLFSAKCAIFPVKSW